MSLSMRRQRNPEAAKTTTAASSATWTRRKVPMASIKLPDGSIKELPDGTTVAQLSESIGKRLAQAAIVGKVDGKLVDLACPLTGTHEVSIITERDPDGLFVMRHSTAHVL